MFAVVFIILNISVMRASLKAGLHPRNKHFTNYDFNSLCDVNAKLRQHVFRNVYGTETINFSNPLAVVALNEAILKHSYGINFWEIPDNFLCPPIPGRVDYIHNIADLLRLRTSNKLSDGSDVKGLDIGVGASAIYPLLGYSEYRWNFVGTDCNPVSVKSACNIINKNNLTNIIDIRLQNNPRNIFKNVINSNENFDFSMCNPPFHSTDNDAQKSTIRKWRGLGKSSLKSLQNFGGQHSELSYPGGEISFITAMILESNDQIIRHQIEWFTTLVSKKSNLPAIYRVLNAQKGLKDVITIEMAHGNKQSRIVAWTYG